MALQDFFTGTPERTQQISRYTPEQINTLNQLLSMGLGRAQNPTAGYAPIAEQSRERFQQQTLPSLFNRLSSLGGGASGSFQRAGMEATRGLESDIRADQARYGLQNQRGINELLSIGLTPQFDTKDTERDPSLFEPLAGEFIKHIGSRLGDTDDNSFGNILAHITGGAATGGVSAGPLGAAGGGLLAALPFMLQYFSKKNNQETT